MVTTSFLFRLVLVSYLTAKYRTRSDFARYTLSNAL
jgi:hypothetical protein